MTVIAKVPRDSSIELFRIVCMLSIVACHYVNNSGLFPLIAHGSSVRDLFLLCFGAWGKVAINCFVLITGYFMCEKSITAKKFLRLYAEVVTYNVLCNVGFIVTGQAPFSLGMAITTIFPFAGMNSSFASAFLAFYLLIPFLNMIVSHCSRRQHEGLLAIALTVLSVFAYVKSYRVSFNYVEWFSVVYLVGAYLRKYPIRLLERRAVSFSVAIMSVVAVCLSVIVMSRYVPGGYAYYFVVDSNKLSALLIAVAVFLAFKNLRIGYSRAANLVASTTFGVFLIHANSDLMRKWLWQDVCNNVRWYASEHGVLHAVVCVVLVFSICSCVDLVRQAVAKRLQSTVWFESLNIEKVW